MDEQSQRGLAQAVAHDVFAHGKGDDADMLILRNDGGAIEHWNRAELTVLIMKALEFKQGWAYQDLQTALASLRQIGWHLGVIGDHEDGTRQVLLVAPGLRLDEDEQGVCEVSPGDIEEQSLRAIDELKTLVVYLHRRLVEAQVASRQIASLVDVSTISTNPHDWAMTLTQIRDIVATPIGGEPGAIEMGDEYVERMRNFPIRSQYERAIGDRD